MTTTARDDATNTMTPNPSGPDRPKTEDLLQALAEANGKDHDSAEHERVRHILREKPELAEQTLGHTTRGLQKELIQRMATKGLLRDFIEARCQELREGLGYAKASIAERLLIDQVVITYLRLVQAERALTRATEETRDTKQVLYWEKRVSAAQRRHVRAIESLTRVRKLLGRPQIQINVAMNGGQQVVSNE